MRKGFNGLSGIFSEHMEQELGQNIVYVFINKQKDKLSYFIGELVVSCFITNYFNSLFLR
jgi:hypothetical protein